MDGKTESLETSRKELNLTGMRVTNQRALLLGIICRGQGHLDADEIYRQACEKQPRISLSTVYRALQLFKKMGLVEELHFDQAHHHYEMKPATEHHHLVCLGCGRVVEFKCPLSQKMRDDVSRKKRFEVTDVEVRMRGYCSKCRQARK